MKHGLVLEGGAMRGLFTAGVLDIFMENGIDFDGTVGVSAGATFGCNIKSRQPGRTLRYNLRFAKESHYGSFRSLLITGDYYNEEFCYHKVPEELDLFDTETYQERLGVLAAPRKVRSTFLIARLRSAGGFNL